MGKFFPPSLEIAHALLLLNMTNLAAARESDCPHLSAQAQTLRCPSKIQKFHFIDTKQLCIEPVEIT